MSGGNDGRNPADHDAATSGRAERSPAADSRFPGDSARFDAGMAVRREVLGDEHVDRANVGIDEFTADFQDMITRTAWGEIWTRSGLDRRMRSAITMTALIAGGHMDELGMHVRAALRNGLTPDEIKEVLLQSAIYCSVPSANSAFKIAQPIIAEAREQ
ncbi:4-carboxymuconolactone decarboxylase [Arthrobacter castelli]|uniref:4-carboxymuconolactone decarboxylase n=1 Tax=Arthrobacter castelli TaxID=271431 RepID=UPI0004146999|nr:4-carboxymuconolactone decarboxylase [Arthrobacter castelli]